MINNHENIQNKSFIWFLHKKTESIGLATHVQANRKVDNVLLQY